MPDLICDTSPIQYLHQLDLLHILPALGDQVIIPPAVVDELAVGRSWGISLPEVEKLDWISIHSPVSVRALPLVTDLGPGETEVLMLALERREAVVVIDDALARRVAETLDLQFTGTFVHRPWSIDYRPQTIVHRPSSMVQPPSSNPHRPSSIVYGPTSIVVPTFQPCAMVQFECILKGVTLTHYLQRRISKRPARN